MTKHDQTWWDKTGQEKIGVGFWLPGSRELFRDRLKDDFVLHSTLHNKIFPISIFAPLFVYSANFDHFLLSQMIPSPPPPVNTSTLSRKHQFHTEQKAGQQVRQMSRKIRRKKKTKPGVERIQTFLFSQKPMYRTNRRQKLVVQYITFFMSHSFLC